MARCPELRVAAALVLVGPSLGCDDAPSAQAQEEEQGPAQERTPPDDADLAAVQAWLHGRAYRDWERLDPGTGVYLSPELAASLRAGASVHPVGAAAVREIVDLEDPEVQLGWAYSLKLEARGGAELGAGEAWFFYEVFSTEREAAPLVAERGAPGCVGCHADGVDYVQTRP